MLRSSWRQFFAALLFLLIASCSGGGCSSGCSSCGIAPVAGGFDPAKTIANSASVRVTKPGLEFLSANLPSLVTQLLGRGGSGTPGVITFDVPSSTINTTIVFIPVTIKICPNGANEKGNPPTCVAAIDIGAAKLNVAAVTPDSIEVTGTVPVVMRDLPLNIPVFSNVNIAMGDPGSLTCNSAAGSDANYGQIPVTITLPLVAETVAPRTGYTKIDAKNAVINVGLQQNNIKICSAGCGGVSGLCDGILSLLQGTIFSQLQSQIGTVIQQQLQTQLCTKANPALSPSCPIGSHPDPAAGDAGASSASCLYDADATQCVPTELGFEGHMNLGTLLSSISPGTSGFLDFALAAGGNMDPAPGAATDSSGNSTNGMTLGMLGGAIPQPQSDCVPVAPNPRPSGLVVPDQMKTDTVPNWPAGDNGPDFGVALDNQFLNYALGSVYNSGLLCLGISTENFQQLNTGLVSVLIPSMKTLTFEEKGAAIAITTRPQKPPVLSLGGGTDINKDPLLSVLLPSFALDFYIWSEDRYVRGFTYTADLTIPVNIQTGVSSTNPTGGLLPTLGTIAITNGAVTNNALITDDPTAVGGALAQVLSSMVGQIIGSGIPSINLSGALSSLGLSLNIPPGGVRKITQGSEAYLAIFGDLGIPGKVVPQIDTQAQLVEKTVHAEAMQLTTMSPSLMPSVRVRVSSPADNGAAAVEYAWRIDQGTWSAWSRDRDVTVRDPMLFMQAKHVLQVVARLADDQASQDPTPAEVPFTIDVLPPSVSIAWNKEQPSIKASDFVSPAAALVARTRGTDSAGQVGEWSAWSPLAETALDKSLASVEVQVRDEEGNVGSVSSALVRGGPDPTLPTSGGCSSGCSTGAHSDTSWAAVLLGLAGLAALGARRRGGRGLGSATLAIGSVVAVTGSSQGCNCGGSDGAGAVNDAGVEASIPEAGPVLPDGAPVAPGCGSDCKQPCGPGLPQGLIGAYTSLAKAPDGTLWVAGYNDAAVDPANGIQSVYGDLVVGKYDTTKQLVNWVTVDGLPAAPSDGSCPDNDPTGWRHGLLDSGPDVGLWTSLQLDANGHPMVSYYDATNQAIKFASSNDGIVWSTHAIYANMGSDAGRYSKMILVNGMPVVAYLVIDNGTNGYSKTRVSIAHATKPVPASPSDWNVEDALVDDQSPCRPQDCAANQACVVSSGICAAVSAGCDAGCGTGQACIVVSGTPSCTKVAQTTDIHPYPDAVGDYISLAATKSGLGMVVYDRIHGNLLGVTNGGGSWAVTILDGETGSRANGTAVDTGNDGIGASLFVAANDDWHVSYVNALTEQLKYLYVPGGALANNLVPQVVDDGSQVDGNAFPDGVHLIGDDSFVRQNSDGSISITYQDSTAGTLRTATGSTMPGKWTLHAITQPKHFAGFFPHFVPDDTSVANWWRWADPKTMVITGDVAIVAPQ